jgi:UDP-N-acetylglucosamine 2-epimerase
VHPRTRQSLQRTGLWQRLEAASPQVELLPALGYVDFLRRLAGANKAVTDSGTVRREAYLLGKPVITPVEINWWPEIEKAGWNRVVGPHAEPIAEAIRCFEPTGERPAYFGDGHAEERIIAELAARFS